MMSSHGQISSGGDIEMPAFRIRQRMAMKIAAKKSAEGYQLSDDRCEFCEMQLFAMNGNVTCKVCPALQKLVQMKHNGVGDQREVDDARETTEIVGVDTESRDSEVVDNDDTSKSFHNATDDTAVSLPMKAANNDAVCSDGNESVLEVTEQNLDECEPEDAETNAHSQDKEHQIHAEVGIAKDSVQTDVVNNDTAETEPIVEEEPSSIIRDMEMPTFRIRQRIAMKVASKKTAKGYLVSDERCDLCEMPLLSMNGNLSCKVCPAIEKWAQKKSEARLSIDFVDAHDTFESAEKQSESREDGLDGRDDSLGSVGPSAESGSDSIGIESEGTDTSDSVQYDDRDELVTVDNEVSKAEEPILSSVSIGEGGIEMPTFRIRQRIAMKITAKKTLQGFLVSGKRCDLCEMPLLSMNDILTCKVCPAIEKLARKKNTTDGVSHEVDAANMTVVTTLKETESGDQEHVDSVYRDETSAPLAYDVQVLSPQISSAFECQHDEKMISQELTIGKVEGLYDALSPCSILTSPGSFRDDEQLGENGMETTAGVVIANVQNDTSSDSVPPASEMPLLLDQIKAVSLVDDEAELEEKCSHIKVDVEIEANVTATSAVQEHALKAEAAQDDIELVVPADTTSHVLAENIPFTDVAVETEATNEVELKFLGSAMFQACDDNTFHELQKAKFELSGMLAGCKLDLMTDTVDKLRSIFNCNVGEADDFRSMFVDERNQSFEYDEQTMLLVMRGWMVSNAHCRRCSESCMVLRPVDGEMMCPKCDDVESGPAVMFPSHIEPTMQHAPIEHESPRQIVRSRDVVPSHLNKWTTVDRVCVRCSRQLMRNPNLETDHCPTCGPVLTDQVAIEPDNPNNVLSPTAGNTVQVMQSLNDTSYVQQATYQLLIPPPPVECDLAAQDDIECDDDSKENDILDANMLKELRETMKQIEEAKQFLLSRRTPRMTPLPPTSNKSLQQMSPALMQKNNMPSSARVGILKPSGYRTPQLNKSSGHQTPQLPGKIFFA